MKSETGPHIQRTRRDQRRRHTTPDWKVASLISKGTCMQGLSWAGCKVSRFLHPPTRILKVYIKALTGFSHIHYPEDLNNTLFSQGCILENGSHWKLGRTYIPRMGRGQGASSCPGPAHRLPGGHIVPMTSSNRKLLGKRCFRVMVSPPPRLFFLFWKT